MRKLLFFLLFSFVYLSLSAQQSFRTGQMVWVIAKSGLSVREGAGTQHDRIGKLDFGQKIRVLDPTGELSYVEGIPGDWVKMESGNLKGYVFDGFLSVFPPPRSQDNYPPVKKWLGEFADLEESTISEEVIDEGTEYESTQEVIADTYSDDILYISEEDDMSLSEKVFLPETSLYNAFLLGRLIDPLYKNFDLTRLQGDSWHAEDQEDGREVRYEDMDAERNPEGGIQKLTCRVHIMGSYTWMILSRQEGGTLLEMGSRAD